APPLSDRVAATFHASAVGAVIGMQHSLLLGLRLLILGRLLLTGPTAPCHGAKKGPNPCAFARITGNHPDRGAARGPPGGPHQALAPTDCGASLLRWRTGRHHCRVNARGVLGPRVAVRIILALLLLTLAFRWVDNRLLGLGCQGRCEDGQPKAELQGSF